jgi:hypothetical protein
MSRRPKIVLPADVEVNADWEALDSRVFTAVQEIQTALEQALAATRDLSQWVERLHSLSMFVRQVESGLLAVRHQLKEPPQAHRPVLVPSAVPKADSPSAEDEPWPFVPAPAEPEAGEEALLSALETQETESGAEPSEAGVAQVEQLPEPARKELEEGTPPVSELGATIRLEIESSGANIDLMVVERALRETPGVADVDLLDYAGKRARLQVTLVQGERSEETADPERLAANVRERLAKLTWSGGLSVSAIE